MPVWLSVLIIIFAALLVVNAIAYFALWRIVKNPLFKLSAIAWGFNFLNFLIHGIAQDKSLLTLFGHSLFFITAICLSAVLAEVSSIRFFWKKFIYSYPLILLLAFCVFSFLNIEHNYFFSALVLDISIAFTLFKVSFAVLRKDSKEPIAKLFAVLLILNGIHFLDYPFIDFISKDTMFYGMNLFEILTVFGFSFALFLSILVSIILPLLIFEAKSRVYHRDLENEVNIKTLELKQYNEKLEQSNLDSLSLVSMVCHDIATPLMVMQHNLGKISKHISILPDDANTALGKLNNTFLNLSELLKRVREMHSGRIGKFQPKLEFIDPMISIHEVVDSFESKANEKQVKILIERLYVSEININIDPMVFKNQILGNLISNAIKFSKVNSSIQLRVKIIDNKFVIEIQDFGVGIDNQKINDVFRFDQSTTTLGTSLEKGTGLGLPTVKIMTENLGGQISVVSQFNQGLITSETGTTFTLKFPLPH